MPIAGADGTEPDADSEGDRLPEVGDVHPSSLQQQEIPLVPPSS